MSKLTKAQVEGLRSIEKWERIYREPFNKAKASKSLLAVRSNVLEKLLTIGLISSASPFRLDFYCVTLTDEGRAALEEKP